MPIQVVIPAAGRIRDSTDAETLLCPLFRTIAGKSFISLILEKLKNSSLDISVVVIGVHSTDKAQLEFLIQPFSKQIEFKILICDHTTSAVETLAELIESVPQGDKVLVNLGDTLVDIDWDLVANHSSGLAVTRSEMPIDRLATFPVGLEDGTMERRGLVGVYWFAKGELLPPLEAIQNVEDFVLYNDSTPFTVEATTWIDADYSDRFTREASLNFESRNFNSVKRPSGSNLIYKSSSKIEKLKSEYEFIANLDPEAASLFPAVRSFKVSGGVGVLAMDYWPYSNLSDMYCFSKLGEGFWAALMQQAKSVLQTLHSGTIERDTDLFHWAFIDKTKERLTQLQATVDWFEIADHTTEINGLKCESTAQLLEKAEKILSNRDSAAARVHGDFCFSNILVDPNSMMIKLVDPRGGFKSDGVLGPLDYDLAKFAHSILGDYDLILKNLFELSDPQSSQIDFSIHYPPHQQIAKSAFVKQIAPTEMELETLRLLSALILMSIPPLHLEDEHRARMFLIKGRYDAQLAISRLEELGR
jgi:aminoglycoside phosphotransferase